MQQCPKCASSVPDGRTECHICGAALDPEATKTAGPTGLQIPTTGPRPLTEEEAADLRAGIPGIDRPGAKQEPEMDVLAKQIGGGGAVQQGGVELKRTLSGEVVEVPVSSAPVRPGGPMLGRTPGPAGPAPIPTVRPGGRPTVPPLRTGSGPVVAGEAARSGSSAGIIIVVLLLIVLAGAAGGYWYWIQSRPKAAVAQFLENLNKHEWGAVYDQVELPSQFKSTVTKDAFTRAMSFIGSNLKINSYEIKSSRIEGETATVTVTVTMALGGQTQTNTRDIKLRQINGEWKIDATGGAPSLPGLRVPRLPGRG